MTQPGHSPMSATSTAGRPCRTGLREGVIDVHSHICTPAFPDDPANGRAPGWPCMACAGAEASILIDGKVFRKLDDRSWDVVRRIEDMDRDGVAVQALSPMPELLSYWFDEARSLSMCDHVNGFIAEMIAQAPDRFCGLGMVPLQFPDLAAEYLSRLEERFGLCGIEIGSNILGRLPGDRTNDNVFLVAQDQDLAIFVHALHPLTTAGLKAPAWFTPTVGFPLDVGMAAASVIGEGVLDRFPGLRMGFSHGGGALGSMLGRMDQAWVMTGGFGGALSRRPTEAAAQLFYDSNLYDASMLAHLTGTIAPDHVFLGTDYPYDVRQQDPLPYLAKVDQSPVAAASLRREAALQFLGFKD